MNPAVSCLCVTENRTRYLKRAIECFQHQTHANKELVIIFRDGDLETVNLIKSLTDPQIQAYAVPSDQKVSLGYLRNYAIANSKGGYFCQWDDDDWYHPDRITQQLEAVQLHQKTGSLLSHLLMFDTLTQQAYFSFERPWENTLFCNKDVFISGSRYANLSQKEDTFFIRDLVLANKLCPVSAPPSYIYIFHGHNTWNRDHFLMLFNYSQPLNEQANKVVADIVNGNMTHKQSANALRDPEFLSHLDRYFRWRNYFNEVS